MDRSDPERIGILGGTFNPVHFGHLAIAKASQEQAALDKVVFVPAYVSPHKQAPEAEAGLRYEMIKLAIEDNDCFAISSFEIDKQTVSYSVETLEYMRSLYPRSKLFFIIGSDSAGELDTWKNIARIFELCTMIVARRPKSEAVDPALLAKDTIFLKGIYPDISSTQIREALKQGSMIKDLVPGKVADFILSRKLYT